MGHMDSLRTPHPAPLYRYRWAAFALLTAGLVLWIATGHWQWILLPISLLYAMTFTYLAILPRHVVAALAPHKPVPDFTRGERLTEAAGLFVMLGGVNAWAWLGEWRFALTGAGVWATAAMWARLRAGRRRVRRYSATAALSKDAERLMEQGRFGQGAAAYEQSFSDTGISGTQALDLVATALYSRAVDLERQGRREEATAAYLELLSRYSIVSTSTAAELVVQTRRRLRALGR